MKRAAPGDHRYDDIKHELVDPDKKKFPGVDYYNPHFGKPKSIDKPLEDYLDRTKIPRMPWYAYAATHGFSWFYYLKQTE